MNPKFFYFVEAGWNYTATKEPLWTGEIDISFIKGEKLVVVDGIGNGWVRVDKGGTIGAAPEAYLKRIECLEAVWEYKCMGLTLPNGERDLSFGPSQRMILLELLPNGWGRVRFEDSKQVGLVPLSFVKKLEPSSNYVRKKLLRSPSNAIRIPNLKEPDTSKWEMTSKDKEEWNKKFVRIAKDGFLPYGRTLSNSSYSSRSQDIIRGLQSPKILSDIRKSGQLSSDEYAISQFLFRAVLQGFSPPSELPDKFLASVSQQLFQLNAGLHTAEIERTDKEANDLDVEAVKYQEAEVNAKEAAIQLQEQMRKEREELERLANEQKELEKRRLLIEQKRKRLMEIRKPTESTILGQQKELSDLEKMEKEQRAMEDKNVIKKTETLRRKKNIEDNFVKSQQEENKAKDDADKILKRKQEVENRKQMLLQRKEVLQKVIGSKDEEKFSELQLKKEEIQRKKEILLEKKEFLLQSKRNADVDKQLEERRRKLEERKKLLEERKKKLELARGQSNQEIPDMGSFLNQGDDRRMTT